MDRHLGRWAALGAVAVCVILAGVLVTRSDDHDRVDGTVVLPSDVPAPCGATSSTALGTLNAWKGEVASAAFLDWPVDQLWVTVPGADPQDAVLVRATRPDGRLAELREGIAWDVEATIRQGGRSAPDFGTHWVIELREIPAGCWKVHVEVGDVVDDIEVPFLSGSVMTPTESASTQ